MSTSVRPSYPWLELDSPDATPCPYLDGRLSRLSLALAEPDPQTFDQLLARGYRRSGSVFYRPDCPSHCRACIPLRLPLSTFRLSKSQRRLLRSAHTRFQIRRRDPIYTDEHFILYDRHARHLDTRSDQATPDAYYNALVESGLSTHFFEYRIDGQLVAVSILDEGQRSASSVYAFWHPDYHRTSPGTYSALWEIAWAIEHDMDYYYLGYWIDASPRMRYKTRFKPAEMMEWSNGLWTRAV